MGRLMGALGCEGVALRNFIVALPILLVFAVALYEFVESFAITLKDTRDRKQIKRDRNVISGSDCFEIVALAIAPEAISVELLATIARLVLRRYALNFQ